MILLVMNDDNGDDYCSNADRKKRGLIDWQGKIETILYLLSSKIITCESYPFQICKDFEIEISMCYLSS